MCLYQETCIHITGCEGVVVSLLFLSEYCVLGTFMPHQKRGRMNEREPQQVLEKVYMKVV